MGPIKDHRYDIWNIKHRMRLRAGMIRPGKDGGGGHGRGLCVSKYMMGVWEWEESKDNGTKLCLVTAKSSGHQLKYRIDFFF